MRKKISFFSDNLKYLRKKKSFSQRALANELGITNATISVYESGESNPSIDNLEKLSWWAGVTIDELMFEDLSIKKISINKQNKNTEAVTQEEIEEDLLKSVGILNKVELRRALIVHYKERARFEDLQNIYLAITGKNFQIETKEDILYPVQTIDYAIFNETPLYEQLDSKGINEIYSPIALANIILSKHIDELKSRIIYLANEKSLNKSNKDIAL